MNRDVAPLHRGCVVRVLHRSAVILLAALTVTGCSRPVEPEVAASAPRLRLITTEQYINTLAHIFGPSVNLDVKFPPPKRVDGLLANGTAVAGVTAHQLEQFQRAAVTIAAQVVDTRHREFLIPCRPASESAADQACATQFIRKAGRLLYRRALSDAELDAYVQEAGAAADRLKDFYAGLGVVLEAMLISPEFLFIVERAEPDPERPGQFRLDAYSLASRLSFFLWNAGPDDELLTAAETGVLQTKKGLGHIVDRMLASPRLEAGIRAFFDDMFVFEVFSTLSKDPTIYPFFTGVMAADAREQTLRTVVDHLIRKKGDYRDLYTTRSTFISPTLAALYQMPAPVAGWTEHEFPPDSPRAGLLTHVSFLAMNSHPGRSSPTLRGKALRERLLCQKVPAPPPNVDFSIVENPSANYPTQRDRVNAHLHDPVCAGCHKITDPIGLALENFDGAGRFRLTERDTPIDPSGELDGREFADVNGLAQALHDHNALPSCLVQRLYSYGVGKATTSAERPLLAYFNERFAAEGYRVPELMRTIALSRAFAQVAGRMTTIESGEQEEEMEAPAKQITASLN